MWLYPFGMLVMLSAAFPPLFAVTIAVGILLIIRSRARATRIRAVEEAAAQHRRAALELERRRALILALRSMP